MSAQFCHVRGDRLRAYFEGEEQEKNIICFWKLLCFGLYKGSYAECGWAFKDHLANVTWLCY